VARSRETFLLAVLVGLLPAAARTSAAEEADGRPLLEAVAKAYKALPAYADQGEIHVDLSVDGQAREQVKPLRVTVVRPNLLKVEADVVTAVSDGKSLTTSVASTKRFAVSSAPSVLSPETFRAGPLGSALFGGPADRLAFMLLNFLVGRDPVKTILAELDAQPRLEGEREIDGVKCPLLRLDANKGPDYRLVVDPKTKLLRAIEVVFDPKDTDETLPGSAVTIRGIEWRAGRVETTAPKESLFGYKPPDGYGKVEPFDKVVGAQAEAPKHGVEELIGQPAPNFSLTVVETPDKFQTVTKDDLAGKVVVLDFWATWCAPCLAELPEIQKLVDGYAKDKKDVVVIALSQDQQPNELKEVRRLVDQTLKAKKIALTDNPVGKIALDPSGTVGDAFRIEGYPTVVILDAKGVVQAAHVGFRPDVREVLTRDIDTLLEGKSLAKPKPKAND